MLQIKNLHATAEGKEILRGIDLEVKNTSAQVEHEASTSKIGEDQIFYCRQRGISTEDAVSMIVHGFWTRAEWHC